MSRRWTVYCRSCDDELPSESWEVEYMRGLAKLGDSLRTVALTARTLPEGGSLKLGNDFGGPPSEAALDWFATHGRHSLIARNDDKIEDNQCAEPVECSHCGNVELCVSERGHPGEHAGEKVGHG